MLKTSTFWFLSSCFARDSIAFQGVNLSLAPYIQDLGYKNTMLSTVIIFRSIVMVTTVRMMGFLAERAHSATIRVVPFVIQVLGDFFFLGQEPIFLWLGGAFYFFVQRVYM